MRTLVIYKSKTGYTKKYADWIAEELSADIRDVSECTADIIRSYDTIIFGGGLYAVGINGVKIIKQNLHQLEGKKIIVFATGVSPSREEALIEVRDQNFTFEEQKQIKFFYLRGGFEYSRLNPIDKILMTLLKLKIKGKKDLLKKELTLDEIGMLAAYEKPVDFSKRKYIDKLVSYASSN